MTSYVEKWGLFEIELAGSDEGNPFAEVDLSAKFICGHTVIEPRGFYDGNGIYKIRCMPTQVGEWMYTTHSNRAELDGQTGTFTCVEPSGSNHGPVYVHNQYHFAYADGTPYWPFGTTCYAWVHQGDALEEQTLQTLAEKPFNKMRMCVFPKHYPFNHNEPVYHLFERDAEENSDLTRFNPDFFHHFEKRLSQLLELGIEADIILWHPYDRWGYSEMDEAIDYHYLRYIIARFSAFRHIWWSLANEYDFLLNVKPVERWDNFFHILQTEDPYQHLRSIHNGDPNANYDHTKPGITHVSIQNWDVKRIKEWRHAYGKPIVNDELEYEGNIPFYWGNISAEEMVHRFWIMTTNGGYAGHGETYMHPDDVLWWSKGGLLHGDSWQGIAFLKTIMADIPPKGLTPIADIEDNGLFYHRSTRWYWTRISGGMADDYYLIYLGEHQIAIMPFWSNDDQYEVEIIDTREMTIKPIAMKPFDKATMTQHAYDGTPLPSFYIELPSKPYLVVRIKRKAALI
jgi:hypothetical protein